jgi:hypothetical protein
MCGGVGSSRVVIRKVGGRGPGGISSHNPKNWHGDSLLRLLLYKQGWPYIH